VAAEIVGKGVIVILSGAIMLEIMSTWENVSSRYHFSLPSPPLPVQKRDGKSSRARKFFKTKVSKIISPAMSSRSFYFLENEKFIL
jgi:hypothetical protein